MKKALEPIKIPTPGNSQPYFSDGEFSMHQLIEHVLMQTGKASVMLSSFSITEDALRCFCRLIESGHIDKLECLFDFTVKRHKLGLLFFASNVVGRISIAKCHAKVVLIKNDAHCLAIVSSANLNINDKIEAGIIISDPSIFEFYYTKLSAFIANGLIISPDEFNG